MNNEDRILAELANLTKSLKKIEEYVNSDAIYMEVAVRPQLAALYEEHLRRKLFKSELDTIKEDLDRLKQQVSSLRKAVAELQLEG